MKWAVRFVAFACTWLLGVTIWIAVGPAEQSEPYAHSAIVLGAAVDTDTPSPVFAARIDHAVTLYKQGRVSDIYFTGARSPEDTISEAAAARDYAIAAGVPASDIIIEESSRTTHQNLSEVRDMHSVVSVPSVIIVSDPLHLRRALVMANGMGFDAQASATPTTRYRSWSTKAPFLLREVYFIHHYWIFGE
ncbi:YdcF family protein [uncultured Erythrobacter sp.]|uniref:YdcF family protein n=1 Tax=uncultured Erythrobacter sp. TaxID=263913 RepID=UPI002639D472|nr:YdcF family protein [uncultured Erythrobacter sp.]